MQQVCFAEEFIALYPNAKAVLTVCDNLEVWCKSIDKDHLEMGEDLCRA
jgi:hypothetical protein